MKQSSSCRVFQIVAITCVLSTNGCAAGINYMFDRPNQQDMATRTEATPDGKRLIVTMNRPHGTALLRDVLGYGADAFVAGNLVRLVLTFRSDNSALFYTVLAGALGIGGDVLISSLGGAWRQRLWTPAMVAVKDRESGEILRKTPLVAMNETTFEAMVPVLAEDRGRPLEYVIIDDQDRMIGRLDLPVAGAVATVGPMPEPKVRASKPPIKERTVAKLVPPQLSTEVDLKEPVGDRALHGGLDGTLVLTVLNQGKGPAQDVVARLSSPTRVPGLSFPAQISIGDVQPGQSVTTNVPIKADKSLDSGNATILVAVEDANRFDAAPTKLVFETRKFEPVRLVADQVGVTTTRGDSIPRRGEQVDLQVMVRNRSPITARQASVELKRDHKDLLSAGEEVANLGDIPPGGWKVANFSLFVRNSYNGPQTLPLKVRFTEASGDGNQEQPIAVALEKSSPTIAEVAVTALKTNVDTTEAPELVPDVDRPLPKLAKPNPDAVALVVGIESYSGLPGVTFAKRDALAMKNYLKGVMGVEEENLILLTDENATNSKLQVALEHKLKSLVNPGKSEVYVYFAGHGAPDAATKAAYLVPYDADPNYIAGSCYPVSKVYSALGRLGAKHVTVMLDACFTGQDGRKEQPTALTAGVRPLFIEAIAPTVPEGLTVFAAAGPSQMSSAYPEKRHGLFTYYMLKALRGEGETRGKTTIREIQEYVADQVSRRARRMGREQTPILMDSSQSQRNLIQP